MRDEEPETNDEDARLKQALDLFAAFQAPDPDSEETDATEKIEEALEWLLATGNESNASAAPAAGSEAMPESVSRRLDELSRKNTDTRFHHQGELARGGMGAILKVFDKDLRRTLAMKVALGHDGSTSGDSSSVPPAVLSRFIEEAQVTSQLDHPGIVPVHELGLGADGRAYFTMKLVEGRDLKEIFEDSKLGDEEWSQARLLGILLKVCDAMAYAHDKGVVHRDLKPSNVMVGRYGEVYVMDWGLARAEGSTGDHDLRLQPQDASSPTGLQTDRNEARKDASKSPLITVDGAVVGTPYFMPPEQARGDLEAIGQHSDVYAVGAMLYRALAGKVPYEEPDHPSPRTVLAMVLQGPPRPLGDLAARIPAELEAICEKAMARDPANRYASMSSLGADLRAWLEGRVVTAHETGPITQLKKWVSRNRKLASALALAVVALVGGSGVAMQQRNIARSRAKSLDASLQAESRARTVAEGHRLAAESLVVSADDPTLALLLAIEAGSLAPGTNANRALYSALANQREAHIFNGHDAGIQTASVSPDGRWVHSADGSLLQILWDVVERKRVWSSDDHQGRITTTGFSNDDRLTFSASMDGTLRVWETETGDPRVVHEVGSGLWHALYDPDSQRILVGCDDGRILSLSTTSSEDSEPISHHSAAVLCLDLWQGTLASICDLHQIQVRRLREGELLAEIDASEGTGPLRLKAGFYETRMAMVGLGTDAKQVAVRRANRRGGVWDVRTGKKIHPHGESYWKRYISISPDREHVVATSDSHGQAFWSLNEETEHAAADGSHPLAFTSDSKATIAQSLRPGDVAIVTDVQTGETLDRLIGHKRQIRWAASVAGGNIITASADRTLRLWTDGSRTKNGVPRGREFYYDRLGRRAIVERKVAVSELDSGTIENGSPGETSLGFVYVDRDGKREEPIPGARLFEAGWTRDGTRAWLALMNGPPSSVAIWNAERSQIELRRTYDSRKRARVNANYALSDDGRILAECEQIHHTKVAAGKTTLMTLVDVPSGEVIRQWEMPFDTNCCDFSPDGSMLAIANRSNNVATVWNTADGQLIQTLHGHSAWVLNVRFSPDGSRLATYAVDSSARIYDTADFSRATVVHEVTMIRGELAWAPDSKKLLVYSAQFVGLHDAINGQTITYWPFDDTRRCKAAGFSEDGDDIWFLDNDGFTHRYPTDPLTRCREIAPRQMTPGEMKNYNIGTTTERATRESEIRR